LDVLKGGDEESAGGAVFDEESLNFKVGRVEEIVESSVVVEVLVIDVDALLDELVGQFLIGDDDRWLGVVTGAEDSLVKCGAAVLVCGLDVGSGCEEFLRFDKLGENILLFGFAGCLIERLDERRGMRNVDCNGRGL
jgi:hypothetical protein